MVFMLTVGCGLWVAGWKVSALDAVQLNYLRLVLADAIGPAAGLEMLLN
ncbi:MAG: hypothetical protein ACYCZ6_07900 [Polaromonas sp.]